MEHSRQARMEGTTRRLAVVLKAPSTVSVDEINREGANMVTPKKWRPLNLGLIGRHQKRFFAHVPGGKTGTKAVTSSARRGALPMWDVAARVKYHITGICVVRHDAQSCPYHEPLTSGYATSEPCLCASFAVTGKVTGNCSTVACFVHAASPHAQL